MKKIVISGPTGVVGTGLIKALLKRDCEIFAVVRPGSRRTDNIPKDDKINIIECDIASLENLAKEIGSADLFYHLAWQGSAGPARNDMYLQNLNIKYALDAVETARQLGCECYIGAGSQAEYGRVEGIIKPDTPCFPENGYGMAKLCAGEMTRTLCQIYGIRHIWPRILSIYGPCDNDRAIITSTIESLIRGDVPKLTKGEQLWDFLYSGDVGEIMARLGESGKNGKIYCLGSGKARLLRDFITELRDTVSPGALLGFGEIPYNDKQVMHLEADITDIINDLKYKPATSFEDGIRKTYDWIKNNG